MRQWHIAAVATLTVMLSASNVNAGEFEGAGLHSCADFTEQRTKDPSMEEYFYGWAQGFMSGMNVARLNEEPGAFKGMPQEQQIAHIRSFCEANPTKRYFEAVGSLYTTLYPKQK